MLRSILYAVLVLAVLACAVPAYSQDKDFVSLFNGKDLSGWHAMGADAWQVKDGLLVCNGEGKGVRWLRSDAQYKDFALKLEYKIPAGGNSGVFFRAAEEGDPSYTGFQIQIYDDFGKAPDAKGSAALVDAVAPSINVSRPAGEWNSMEISCIGSMLTVRHNGRRVIRIDLADPALNAKMKADYKLNNRRPIGYIGVQNHGIPVEFRNIRIRKV
ncbi:MAG: DUF1080 domain-containing protein [Armatimonadota bacterium]|nr:DUF1080 domain-containing protein [Armatimonadota bacterium]